jgi:hypothetical protein
MAANGAQIVQSVPSLNLADYKDQPIQQAYYGGQLDQNLVGAAAVQPAPLPVAAGDGPRKIVRYAANVRPMLHVVCKGRCGARGSRFCDSDLFLAHNTLF